MNSKWQRIIKRGIVLCLIMGMTIIPVKVRAAEVIATVYGTILSGTTADLLLLSTKEGKMEIKLDSTTDTSGCKILLTDKKIYVSVANGNDGYLHAVKITGETQAPAVTLDPSSNVTVSGTIGDKSTESLLYFDTKQGEMQIKLDPATSLSGCAVLIKGKQYQVVCARGSDAYMHAVSITDTVEAAAAKSAYPSVSGTVANSTKESLLYLSTKDGEMQFLIDEGADTLKGMMAIPGRTLTVSFYHGSDKYLHAVAITGAKDSITAVEIDNTTAVTVTGTVESDSNENMLYLKTPQGRMDLKLDAVRSLSNCKILVGGKKLSVTCARGSDAYMHALDISGV